MALENAQMHRDTMEKQRMERELSLARSIQHRLLPEAPPVVPGYDIAVLSDFCFDVAADYYDFINLGPQSLLLVSAEVEGKGVSSALIMANLQATLRALVMHLHSLEVLAFSLNEMLYTYTKAGKHLSVFLGLVDTTKKYSAIRKRRTCASYPGARQDRRNQIAGRRRHRHRTVPAGGLHAAAQSSWKKTTFWSAPRTAFCISLTNRSTNTAPAGSLTLCAAIASAAHRESWMLCWPKSQPTLPPA